MHTTFALPKTNVIRDPLYKTIPISGTALELIDTSVFQRLRRINQLGLAMVEYPSAVHSRFTHALGAYHLARRVLRTLEDRRELRGVSEQDREVVALAALLHDISHYPAAHFLEEYGLDGACHEEASETMLATAEIGEILARCGVPNAAARIAAVIQHKGVNPLTNIVSGACDVDKIDYIRRDAYFCGVDLTFDSHGLLEALTMVVNPETGRREVGLSDRAIPAFEQMLIAKANLYRSVFFHSTVRAATVMMRRLAIGALESQLVDLAELQQWTDDEFYLHTLSRVERRRRNQSERELVRRLVERLRDRQLYHSALTLPIDGVPKLPPAQLSVVEHRLAERLGVEQGEVLLDIPFRPGMLSTDLLIKRESGEVVHASTLTPDDGFALNVAADALYHSSGRIAVFTSTRMVVARDLLLDTIAGVVDEPVPSGPVCDVPIAVAV
jgi:HD superfamily phosphohydrolase